MCAVDRVSKKSAICFFIVFEIGWFLYTTGLRLAIREDRSLLPPSHPLLLPYYPTVVGGQLVIALILLHVGLPSRHARSAIGILSTCLNVIYFACVGYAMIASRFERLTVADNIVMCIGTVLMTTSWSFIQILTAILEPSPQKNLWFAFNLSSRKAQCNPWRHIVIAEKIRFLSSLSIILSAFGWVLSLGGIHNARASVDGHWSMEWTATYIPPLLYLAALLHAGCSGRISHRMHITSSFLSTFFVISMGYMVISGGEFLYFYLPVGNSTQLLLIGGTASLFFWTIVVVLWPYYHSTTECTSPPSIALRMDIVNNKEKQMCMCTS